MDHFQFDFALILVLASAFTGVIWAIDKFALRKRRAPDAKEPVLIEYCRSFFPVLFGVLLIRSFLAEPFRIPSSSMMPTLVTGDFILVNKFAFGLRLPVSNARVVEIGHPKRGDVIVFRFPGNGPNDKTKGVDYIKRVIGVPGDRIEVRNQMVSLNDETLTEPYVQHTDLASMAGNVRDNLGSVTVPPDTYFVLGDNREESLDSRFLGPISKERILGQAVSIYWSVDPSTRTPRWDRLNQPVQ